MKKILSLTLTFLILMCSIFSTEVIAQSGNSGDCVWHIDGTVLIVSGNGVMSNYDRTSAPWGKNITEVIIEDGVTTVGQYAFADCKNLVSVTLPESMVYIRDSAFENCVKLTEIMVPASVKEIKPKAFYNCSALKNIALSEGLTTLGDSAFFGCAALETIVLPKGLTSIPSYAFYECLSLKNVVLGDSVATIGYKAFYRCITLENIILPSKIASISTSFEGCDTIKNVWYGGDEAAKSAISINSKNTALINASWHYSCDFIMEKSATCEADGTLKISSAQTQNEYSLTIPKLPHIVGVWSVEKEPSCDQNGEKSKLCQVCGYKQIAKIDMFGHTFSEWETVTSPTCEKDGVMQRRCSLCNMREEQSVASLGHNHNILVSNTFSTCKTAGETVLKCSVCRNCTTAKTTSGHIYKNGSCIYCDMGARVVESKHNYDNNCDIKQKITFPSAQKLAITFSKETYTEAEYDFIYIIDGGGNVKSKNSGRMLSGRTITVTGDTITIRLTTDESGEEYGYFATVTPISLDGDTNGDGLLNALDAAAVQNALLSPSQNLSCDINSDGLINLVDLIRIKKMLVA